jgi:uncharacterized protein
MAEVDVHPPGAFCWIELATSDQDAAKKFYGSLFGWGFFDAPMGPDGAYTIFQLRGRDVAACYTLSAERQPGVPPHWMLYVATADADATAKRARELGGTVLAPPFDVWDLGRMAVLRDPTSAAFSIWQPKKNTGVRVIDEPNAFCWGQLDTNDTAKAEPFYKALFGWASKAGSDGGMTYTEWILGGKPIGGMMQLPPSAGAPPHWLAYFQVADCDAAAEKAASLGAATHVPPTDIPGTGRLAVFADPQGAFFAIYKP